MALNARNFQPRKQLLSLTSAVRLTLLSWNIEQRRRMLDGDTARRSVAGVPQYASGGPWGVGRGGKKSGGWEAGFSAVGFLFCTGWRSLRLHT